MHGTGKAYRFEVRDLILCFLFCEPHRWFKVSVLAWGVVDRRFEHQSGQT